MVDFDKMAQCRRDLDRANALLDQAARVVALLPTEPQLSTKQGLLIEARRAVESAKAALAN